MNLFCDKLTNMEVKQPMLSQMDRFIVLLAHEFVESEADRMGFAKNDYNGRNEVGRWVDDFVVSNWEMFQRRLAHENKSLMQIFREEWSNFLTRQ